MCIIGADVGGFSELSELSEAVYRGGGINSILMPAPPTSDGFVRGMTFRFETPIFSESICESSILRASLKPFRYLFYGSFFVCVHARFSFRYREWSR